MLHQDQLSTKVGFYHGAETSWDAQAELLSSSVEIRTLPSNYDFLNA